MRRPAAGTPSRAAVTRSSTLRPAAARRSPRSSGRWTVSPPTRARRPPARRPGAVRVLYISPLKALTYDIERNLRAPLTGIALAAERLGEPTPHISVASRTGDTPADDRRQIARHPPDILITTPESLYLMLTSAAREVLARVEYVIVDEVHAIAGSKRGAHLALSLERLEALRDNEATGRSADAADRPVRHATAARHDRAVPRRHRSRPRGHDRRCRRAQAARSPGRRPGRRHVGPRRGPAARGTAGRAGLRARRYADQHLADRSTRGSSSSSGATGARSSSPTAGGSRNGWRSGSTSSPARSSSAPTTAASPASSGSRSRRS